MRNLKKLLAALVAVSLCASVLLVPTYAASEEAIDAGEICEGLGLLYGDGEGVTEEYLDKNSTRMQLAILNARWVAFEDEAYAYEEWEDDENFSDFDDGTNANEENMLAYYWANGDLGFIGTGNNLFEPQGPIMNTHFAKVLLVTMGYPYGDEYDMSNVLDFAYGIGIDLGTREAQINNGDIAIALYTALESFTAMDITFAQYLLDLEVVTEEALIEYGINYKGLEPGEEEDVWPDNFEVVSDAADNFAEVDLTFNAPIDEDSIKKDNIKVDGSKIGSKDKAYVVEDGEGYGKILRIFLPEGFVGAQNETRTIEVSGLKNPVGTTMAPFSKTMQFRDTTAPRVERVEAKGNTRLDIYFTEPVKGTGVEVLGTYQINDKNISAVKPTLDEDYSRFVTIKKIYTTLVAATYTLGVNGADGRIVDWAGNNAGYQRIDFTIEENTEGPIAQAVLDPVYPTKVDIEFDHEIQDDAYISWTENNRTNTSSSTSVDGNVATFEFDDTAGHRVLPLRLTTITLKDAKDYWNNAAQAPLTFDVTPIADTVRPTIVDAGADDQETIWVEFDKKILDDGKYGTWTIWKGSDRVYNDQLNFKLEDDKIVKLTNKDGSDFDSGDYSLTIRDTKDTAKPTANQLLSTTITVNVPDLASPEVLWARWAINPNGTVNYKYINIYFSKEVDFSTAVTRANYKIDKGNGSYINLPNTALVELMSGDRLVRITFADSTVGDMTATPARDGWNTSRVYLQVSGVEDKAGNGVSLRVIPVGISDRITGPVEAVATAKDTIKLQLPEKSTPITTYDLADYEIVKADGSSTNITITDIDLDDDDCTVILTINRELNANATYGSGNDDLAVKVNSSSELTDVYTGNLIPVDDGIDPTWITAYYIEDPEDEYEFRGTSATTNGLVLVFDEEVVPETYWEDIFNQLKIDGKNTMRGAYDTANPPNQWLWTVGDGQWAQDQPNSTRYYVVLIHFPVLPAVSHVDVDVIYNAFTGKEIVDLMGNSVEAGTKTVENVSIPSV